MHVETGALGRELAVRVLAELPERRAAGTTVDWGLPLLADLVTGSAVTPPTAAVAHARVLAWVAGRRQGVVPARLFGGGLADLVAGLTHACRVEPRLRVLADVARARLTDRCPRTPHPGGPLATDYDVISGVSGVVLALAAAPNCRPEEIWPGIRLLLSMCATPDLAGFRHGEREPDPRLRWNVGRLNHGTGHGLAGVLAALNVGYRRLPDARRAEVAEAIGRVAGHLRRNCVRDDRGVLTWSRGSGERFDPADPGRQAWCYGTPGVAWQLAEAGRLRGDPELVELGVASMASLCAAWSDERRTGADPVGDTLSLCHGLPGVLALARGFARRYDLRVAGGLADHLRGQVEMRLADWYDSGEARLTVLDGLAGTLALLLTEEGASPHWLTTLGLDPVPDGHACPVRPTGPAGSVPADGG